MARKKDLSAIKKMTEGFSKLSRDDRKSFLAQIGLLNSKDFTILDKESALSFKLAEQFIENVITTFPVPLGIAVNFMIDGRDYVIPMAIEETSIIAAACKNAKWIRNQGVIETKTISKLSIGQIQLPRVKNLDKVVTKINKSKEDLLSSVNAEVASNMVVRGGGAKDIIIRNIPRGDGYHMVVVHVMINTCDAMGANIINQICEYLKKPIEKLTKEAVGMCIISNLADSKITQAKVIIRDIDATLGKDIEEASLFSQLDPYRAATHNKGIMNAMDAILLATGNDWRAVEAGIHAYASRKGTYKPISYWKMQSNDLHGFLEAPIIVGTVGGVTQLHPIAKICLKILNVSKAEELARVIAAVGLVQNLAALRALVTEGITQGHMNLHVANLALASDASARELPQLKNHLRERLMQRKRVSGKDVAEILHKMRNSFE